MNNIDLFIIRGLPGAGKSSLAAKLTRLAFAADDYFMVDGEYRFDPTKLGEAHADCQRRVRVALTGGYEPVAVANTFCQRWEMEPYFQIVEQENQRLLSEKIRVTVIDLFDAGLSPNELATLNGHGVPAETIVTMRSRYEHDWKQGNPLPPWERK